MNTDVLDANTETVQAVDSSAVTVVSQEVAELLLANVEKLESAAPGIKLDAESFEFKTIGQKARGVFAGHLTMKFKVDGFDAKNPEYTTQPAIKWVAKKDGTVVSYVCASTALVNKITENGIKVGALLEITLTDDKGGNNKKTKLFDVEILSAK